MPANLVPNETIPRLAASIDSPALYWVLRYLQKAGFILNGSGIDDKMAGALKRLAELGLIDPGYSESTDGIPYLWTINGNGSRVLKQLETAPSCQEILEPRFKIHHRASAALMALPEREQLQAFLAMDELQTQDPASWPKDEAIPLEEDKQEYLVRISPDLRAFVRVLDSGDLELFDFVREEALHLFLERLRATGARR